MAFGYKEARACIFAGAFFALLFATTRVPLGPFHRYDVILAGALAIQAALVWFRRETVDELKLVMVFHVLGFALEAFKTHPSIGSWSYPEDGWTKIGTVPLYSGFMYSAVGSYIAQAWRLLDLRLLRYPPRTATIALSAAIYVNFFTNAFLPDVRWLLLAGVLIVFGPTRVEFTPLDRTFWMPLWMAFGLIAFFVWVAENISTLFGAWQYPDQALGWRVVDLSKISSWSLLVIICFVLVAELKHVKAGRAASGTA